MDRRYIDNGEGIIKDSQTGLMWTKKDSWADTGGCKDWNASKSYVSNLTTGGYTDWRLPTVSELKLIYEKSKTNKDKDGDRIRLDPIFASGGAYWFWTSEAAGSSRARGVNFDGGFVGFIFGNVDDYGRDDWGSRGVRAVRFGH